jgi:putative DNA primase/helicase
MMTSVLERATMRDALTIARLPEPNARGFIRCPFHRPDNNPSLHLVGDPGRETGYKCFACGESGGVFDFLVNARFAPDRAAAAKMLEARFDGVRQTQRRAVASFTYDDGDGHPVARIDRIEPGQDAAKDFLPYLATPDGFAKKPGLNGTKLPVYRRTDVLRTTRDGGSLFFTEGEGKADALRNALPAGSNAAVTTIAFGADSPLRDEHIADLAGARSVVLLVDSDTVGRKAGKTRAQRILEFRADMDVRIVDLYPDRNDGSDVADWLKEGHTVDELHQIVSATTRRKGFVPEAIEGALSVQNSCIEKPLPDKEIASIAKSVGRYSPVEASAASIRLEHLTEVDAAHVLVQQYGTSIRYCAKAGGWLLWDGRRWKRDENGSVYRLAEECTAKIADSANAIADLDERKRLLSFAIGLRRRRVLENVVAAAAWQETVAIGDPARFDADPWLFNVANGTIDLRTGELLRHDRTNLLTKLVPIDYNPAETCPRWQQFLDEILASDTETIGFLQRAIGYTLTGSNKEHAMFVSWGTGANGKSTLLEVLGQVLGEYGQTAAPSTFLDRQAGGPTNDLARLRGTRFVSTIETGERQSLAENFVKAVTGGDRISARFLYAEYFDFEAVFKIWLGTNHKPVIKGMDEGIWRRIRLVPFTQRFEGDRADQDLRAKLEGELPGILAWGVRGCLEWQQHGLRTSPIVTAATAAYRSDMDTFAGFLDERCELDETATAGAGELYTAYRTWAEANGEKPLTQRWFGLRLNERGFTQERNKKKRLWLGLRLADR